jgi:hypothetical protein
VRGDEQRLVGALLLGDPAREDVGSVGERLDATASVSGSGLSSSTIATRRPPRVRTTRIAASPTSLRSSSASTSPRTRSTSIGRRRFAAERSIRARWSSRANGRPP